MQVVWEQSAQVTDCIHKTGGLLFGRGACSLCLPNDKHND